MEHEDDDFLADYANDNEELLHDIVNLESDNESFDHGLAPNEQEGEFASNYGETPIIGMAFDNDIIAYEYYNSYARTVGFSVRKFRLNRNRSGVLWKRIFTCNCEGSYSKKTTPKKKREERRFECKAMLEIRLNRGSKFVVTKFVAEHTHDLVPASSSHLLRSQRKIQPPQAGFINQMHSARLKPSQIFSYMVTEAGGYQNLNFIQSDCNNLIMRKRTDVLKRGDSECLLEYFKQKQIEDKSFFYAIRANEDNEICGFFFCDGKARRDYAIFGDVICFDTTFKTNNYNMVCAPIVGINNHGQTTLFGCGLLDGETTIACEWLFKVFLQAMNGKEPKTIFTDQAQAISAAITQVFPHAHHRLCLWHIYQNATKNLSNVVHPFSEFLQAFKRCVYDPETSEEFESSWEDLLEDYGLRDNPWLKGIYELREKWGQCYGRENFCAGMTTTQRSESINKFLKKYFPRNLLLRHFVEQYDKAIVSRREKERQAEDETRQRRRNFESQWNVVIEASKRYTSKIFYCFHDEFKKLVDWRLKLESDDGIIHNYFVSNMEKRKVRSLTYDPADHTVTCSCKKFEFEGILCAHALKLYRELDLPSLPPKYYLKRWSMDSTYGIDFEPCEDAILSKPPSSSMVQYSELSQIAQRIIAKASKNKETFTSLKSILLKVEAKLEKHADLRQERDETNNVDSSKSLGEDDVHMKFRDPKHQKSKGRGSGRLKSCLEFKPKKNASTKRKDKGLNSKVHEMSRPSNSYEHVQGPSGVPNQNQFMASIYQGKHFPYEFPVVASVQGIPNHPIGYPVVRPMLSSYSFMYPQDNIQPRFQVPTRHLSFSDPSTS